MKKQAALTHMLGLVGDGITTSASAALHETEGRELGMSVVYRPIDLLELGLDAARDLPDVLLWAKRLGFSGLNVTQPCKQLVIPLLDELSPRARELGAVNTVVFGRDGRSVGYNTDWCGFQRGLEQARPGAALGQNVVLVGGGGAGAAVAYALLSMGARRLTIVEQFADRRRALVARMGELFSPERVVEGVDIAVAMADADGVVNASPVGMIHHVEGTPVPRELLRPHMWVADCIYLPMETELLRDARELGCVTIDGGGMVVGQAAEAFWLFTGVQPDERRMRRHFLAGLAETDAPELVPASVH